MPRRCHGKPSPRKQRDATSADHHAIAVGLAEVAIVIAALDRLELPQLERRFFVLAPRNIQLGAKIVDRIHLVGTPMGCRLGERRIGEMVAVADAGALFLGLNLALQIGGHMLEIADHGLERPHLAGLLGNVEPLGAE